MWMEHMLHFFPMTAPFGLSAQLIVFDERAGQFRAVRVRDDGMMEEESGRCYSREHSPYTMWTPIVRSNVVESREFMKRTEYGP